MNFSLWNGSQTVWCSCRNTQVRGCCDDPCPLQQNSSNDVTQLATGWQCSHCMHLDFMKYQQAFSPATIAKKRHLHYIIFFPFFCTPLEYVIAGLFYFILVRSLFWFFFANVIDFFLPLIFLLFSFLFVYSVQQCSIVASLLKSLLFFFLALLFFFSALPHIVFILSLVHKLLRGIVPSLLLYPIICTAYSLLWGFFLRISFFYRFSIYLKETLNLQVGCSHHEEAIFGFQINPSQRVLNSLLICYFLAHFC